MKNCRACGTLKELDDYYRHSQMADGFLNICKECVKSRVLRHRLANIESIRKYDIDRSKLPHVRQRNDAYQRWYKKNRPEAYRAHNASQRIPADRACSNCGSTKNLHKHHPDYSLPKYVVTLCVRCHSAMHHGATLPCA